MSIAASTSDPRGDESVRISAPRVALSTTSSVSATRARDPRSFSSSATRYAPRSTRMSSRHAAAGAATSSGDDVDGKRPTSTVSPTPASAMPAFFTTPSMNARTAGRLSDGIGL
jgi:hypothetical protein